MWRTLVPFPESVPPAAARLWHADARVVAELGTWENYVYLVRAGGRQVVLRLVDSTRQPEAAVAAELDFVRYLSGAGLPVAGPVASAAGHVLERIEAPADTVLLASAFEYVDGQILDAARCAAAPPSFWHAWGAAVGHLHAASAIYRPAGPVRGRWDGDELISRGEAILAGAPTPVRGQFAAAMRWLADLGEPDELFGLVHADFHGRNLRYAAGAFRVFDFDDACYSWFPYDLGVGLAWAFADLSAPAARRAVDAMTAGYASVRPRAAGWAGLIASFAHYRRLLDYAHGLNALAKGRVLPADRPAYRRHLAALERTLLPTTDTPLWRSAPCPS